MALQQTDSLYGLRRHEVAHCKVSRTFLNKALLIWLWGAQRIMQEVVGYHTSRLLKCYEGQKWMIMSMMLTSLLVESMGNDTCVQFDTSILKFGMKVNLFKWNLD